MKYQEQIESLFEEIRTLQERSDLAFGEKMYLLDGLYSALHELQRKRDRYMARIFDL